MSKCWVPLMLGIMVMLRGCTPAAAVDEDEGSRYLDEKELEVEQLANQSIANFNQRCELLATCSNPTNCSHDVCAPLKGDREGSICMVVHKNKYCPLSGSTSNTSCKNTSFMNLDYRRGYVRVAETTNLKSVYTMLSICSQRGLDPMMKQLALQKPGVLTRHFFAPIDGTWRVLPGSARSGDDCLKMEPRSRPWYRAATSVVKVVVVLIDLGNSMNGYLRPEIGAGTILDAAKRIATQLLLTLSANDHVNIIMFDSTRVIPLSPSAVVVMDNNSTELESLQSKLNNQTIEGVSAQSNLSTAILAAVLNFDSNPQAAKVIIVITDGVFATRGNVTLPSAELEGVKVFVYKLPQSEDQDIFFANNTLLPQLCAVGGHFEPILKNLENPLLALHKFFSYVANLKRIETQGKPHYGFRYEDFEQIGGTIIVVAKPAFLGDDLIGVAGVTIYIELLGNLTDPVNEALGKRTTGYSAPKVPQVLDAANCSLVNATTQPCGGNPAYYDSNGGLCVKTDTTSTIHDLSCCGGCSVRPPDQSGSGNSHQLGGGIVAGIVLGSLFSLLVLGIAGVLAHRCYCKRKLRIAEEAAQEEAKLETFPGDVD